MPRNSRVRWRRPVIPSTSHNDGGGREVDNIILRNLPRKEFNQLFTALEFVRLKLHQVLHEPGETIKSVYFLNNGLGSVLATQQDGKTAEVGLIGKEGFVGLPIIFGFKTSGLRVVTHADATAYRVEARFLLSILPESRELEMQLQRFSMMLAMQTSQLAACNRLHDVAPRLARRLLMSDDRVGGTTLPLTQDFLAQILGTRRASISAAAGSLQEAGLIAYTRGTVNILDRPKLEGAACDCYQLIERQKMKWQTEAG